MNKLTEELCELCKKDGKCMKRMALCFANGTAPAPKAEPAAYLFQHEDTGRKMCVDAMQVEWGFEKNNPRLIKVGPLYLAPPNLAAEVERLLKDVVALQLGMSKKDQIIGELEATLKVAKDAFPQAHRLALELECLILSCTDTAAYSKWWDSANEALEQWREFCREDQEALSAIEKVTK